MHNKNFLRFVNVMITVTALILVWFLAIHPPTSQAAPLDGPDIAHVAVQFSPSSQAVRQISFTAPISGLLALQMTGYPIETYDFGGGLIAVCSINGIGCPTANCFCNSDRFWNYEYWDGNQWVSYMVGASGSSVANGAVEGWRWSEWGVGSLPTAPRLIAVSKALNWLAQQQSAVDGGYGSMGASVESLLSIGSNGLHAGHWRRSPSAPALQDYIQSGGANFSQNSAAAAGKLAVAIVGADDYWAYQVKLPMGYYQHTSGWFSQDAGVHAWAMLGMSAWSQMIPISATLYLKSVQQSDGGWEWTPGGFGGGTDTNTTALAVQALVAAGEPVSSTAIVEALDYFRASQNNDGGFPYDADSPYGTASDANSTAYVIQALVAAGENPSTWSPAGTSAVDFLLSLQLPDGSFEWQAGLGANLLATQQAIPALMGRFYPLAVRSVLSMPLVQVNQP